jgi:hypothetical protein
MPYDPALPKNNSDLSSAEMRSQLNGLKALIDAQAAQMADLQSQLSPLMPVLNRDANGQWTLSYGNAAQDYWQLWWRFNGNETWANWGETRTVNFPQGDDAMVPPDATWWQVKIVGEDNNSNPITPFSNVISHGPVPA